MASRTRLRSRSRRSGTVFLKTLGTLDMRQEIEPKLHALTGRPAASLVASGEVQFCAVPVSSPPAGTALAAHLPREIQTYIGVSAGVSAEPISPELARRFVQFLQSSEAMAIFEHKGLKI